jgi:hypothetical protein
MKSAFELGLLDGLAEKQGGLGEFLDNYDFPHYPGAAFGAGIGGVGALSAGGGLSDTLAGTIGGGIIGG